MFSFKEPEKCDWCYGTGKCHGHLLKYKRDEVAIIRKTFRDYDPKKSCEDCFGAGMIYPLLTDLTNHELHIHINNKIFGRRLKGR
ncbi:MAG: hypothetical protein V1762_01995 [Nitrospirota bacterium]